MIMSPMQEKQGDKFSYTFTVPGTYEYHCHPHEDLGMKGTIIVGNPSKPGETRLMDHHKMGKMHDALSAGAKTDRHADHDHGAGKEAGAITATGSVKNVNAGDTL